MLLDISLPTFLVCMYWERLRCSYVCRYTIVFWFPVCMKCRAISTVPSEHLMFLALSAAGAMVLFIARFTLITWSLLGDCTGMQSSRAIFSWFQWVQSHGMLNLCIYRIQNQTHVVSTRMLIRGINKTNYFACICTAWNMLCTAYNNFKHIPIVPNTPSNEQLLSDLSSNYDVIFL